MTPDTNIDSQPTLFMQLETKCSNHRISGLIVGGLCIHGMSSLDVGQVGNVDTWDCESVAGEHHGWMGDIITNYC